MTHTARSVEQALRHRRAHCIEGAMIAAFAAAHRFYRKHGFAEIAADALPPAFPRMRVDTMFFRRRQPGRTIH